MGFSTGAVGHFGVSENAIRVVKLQDVHSFPA